MHVTIGGLRGLIRKVLEEGSSEDQLIQRIDRRPDLVSDVDLEILRHLLQSRGDEIKQNYPVAFRTIQFEVWADAMSH